MRNRGKSYRETRGKHGTFNLWTVANRLIIIFQHFHLSSFQSCFKSLVVTTDELLKVVVFEGFFEQMLGFYTNTQKKTSMLGNKHHVAIICTSAVSNARLLLWYRQNSYENVFVSGLEAEILRCLG